MATIADNLQTLINTTEDIKTALTNKGVSPSDALVDVPDEIDSIQTGTQPVLDTLNVTANGTYTPPAGTDGYDEVNVTVSPSLTTYTVWISMQNQAGTECYLQADQVTNLGHTFYDYDGETTPAQSGSRSQKYRQYTIKKGGVITPKSIPSGNNIYVSTDDGATFNQAVGAVLSVTDPELQMVQITQDNQYVDFIFTRS